MNILSQNLTITEWEALAQIAVAIITLAGVISSLWLSVKALREVQTDRRLRQRPYLAFEPGGHRVPIEFVKAGKLIPGVNPEYAKAVLSNFPEGGESVRILDFIAKGKVTLYGELQNYGSGPALSVYITWIPETIWIGEEKFILDGKKRSEPIYSADLNQMPAVPTHISPGKEARLSRIPTFIDKDYEKKISIVEGLLVIEYEDVFSDKFITRQKFRMSTYYSDNPPSIIVTFGDLVTKRKEDNDATYY